MGHHTTAQPALARGWRAAVERGIAGELCDRIVAQRPVPDALLATLASVEVAA